MFDNFIFREVTTQQAPDQFERPLLRKSVLRYELLIEHLQPSIADYVPSLRCGP
jgi:hypothetical protein